MLMTRTESAHYGTSVPAQGCYKACSVCHLAKHICQYADVFLPSSMPDKHSGSTSRCGISRIMRWCEERQKV